MAIQEATPIVLTAEGRITVEGWVRSSKAEWRLVERARVVLLAAAGLASRAVACGDSTLFTALNGATGEINAKHTEGRRRSSSSTSSTRSWPATPTRGIHVVLDNLSTPKPKRDRWLTLHVVGGTS